MNIYFIGDTHGEIDIGKVQNMDFEENSIIIQLGDFGCMWSGNQGDVNCYYKWIDKLKDKNIKLFIIPGNHENYNLIMDLPIIKMNDNIKGEFWYKEIDGFRFHFIKYPEMFINNKRFLCIRGAESIDKHHRKENISWWKQELLSKEEENTILNIIESNPNFDYVVSHTCPKFLIENYLPENVGFVKLSDPVSKFLDNILDNIEFNTWFFGHFHIDKMYGPYICLYNYISKIEI